MVSTIECLADLVTYKKQCVTSGKAKYMVQSLPAITSDFAANIAGVDHVSGEELVNDSIGFAANLIAERLHTLLNGFTVPNSLFDACACAAPSLLSNVSFVSKPYLFGVRIERRNVSSFGSIKLNKLRILTNEDVEGAIITLEEANGETTTMSVNLSANNYVELEMDYRMKTNYLKVYTEGVALAQFPCFQNQQSGCGCGGSDRNVFETDQNTFFNIYRYESNNPNLIVNDNMITGFQPCVSYGCDTELIFCHYKERFALPLLFFTGAQILEASIINPRLNVSTISDIEQRKEVIKDYYQRGNDYLETGAVSIAETLRQTKGDKCIICTGGRTGWATG